MESPTGRWLQAGRVGRPHGLDGSFHVREPTVALLKPGTEVLVEGQQSRITRRAGDDRHPIVRLAGYETRSAAQSIAGLTLLVEQSDAPALDSDEWWAEDLVGCLVHDGGQQVGTVVRLLALPSCEVLEVSRPGQSGELLVPLVSDAVRAVDIQRQRIDIDLAFLGAQ